MEKRKKGKTKKINKNKQFTRPKKLVNSRSAPVVLTCIRAARNPGRQYDRSLQRAEQRGQNCPPPKKEEKKWKNIFDLKLRNEKNPIDLVV